MEIKIITQKISGTILKSLIRNNYGGMIKGAADIEQKRLALGGEMHADAEEKLLQSGDSQNAAGQYLLIGETAWK